MNAFKRNDRVKNLTYLDTPIKFLKLLSFIYIKLIYSHIYC